MDGRDGNFLLSVDEIKITGGLLRPFLPSPGQKTLNRFGSRLFRLPPPRPRRLLLSFGSPKMKVIAAYLLAVLGGNLDPSSDDLKNILSSVGAEADDERIEFLLCEVKGKDITELIASGREKFACVPSGGGAIAVAAPAAGGGGAAAPAAAEPKKEEKVEEKEESDEDMGFSLFD
ncbi:hypothetical protein Taro_045047 [Colocasia esculenta]|uniref:Uncharacterized protein n=1 Tax=Colocasia esculenta TaxID=4460 RepID=A0A843X639_COLES|nr:hypothetical protein [Colocasia esculenta]